MVAGVLLFGYASRGAILLFASFSFFALGGLGFLLAIALWRLDGWSWWAMVLLFGLLLLVSLTTPLALVFLCLIGYLCSPEIRDAFSREGGSKLPGGLGTAAVFLFAVLLPLLILAAALVAAASMAASLYI